MDNWNFWSQHMKFAYTWNFQLLLLQLLSAEWPVSRELMTFRSGIRTGSGTGLGPVLTSLPKVSNSRELGHSADESCSEEQLKIPGTQISCVVIKRFN